MAILDKFLGKWASRKLLVFVIGTVLCLTNVLESSDWVTIASIYIGSQAVVDLAQLYKNR